MATFSAAVRRSKSYKEVIGGRRLNAKEKTLEQAILVIGEQEIGKLNAAVVELEGKVKEAKQKLRADKKHVELSKAKEVHAEQLKNEQQKTQFALLLGGAGNLLGTVARGSVTPWTQLLGGPLPTTQLLGVEEQNAIKDEIVDADFETAETAISDNKSTKQTRSRFAERLLKSMPDWLKAIVMPIAHFFSTLSPLSSAILVIAVVVGAFGWAEWSKSSLRETKNTLQEQNKILLERVSTLDTVLGDKAELEEQERTLNGKIEAHKIEIGRLEAEGDRLRQESKTKDGQISSLITSHKVQLETLTANADEGFKKVNSDLERQIAELKQANKELSDYKVQTAEELGRLRPMEEQLSSASSTVFKLRTALGKQEQRADKLERELGDEQLNVSFLRSLVKGMKQELDRGLLRTPRNGDYYRKLYKSKFNSLLDSHFEFFTKHCNLNRY